MKKCSKCLIEQPEEQFYEGRICNNCANLYRKLWKRKFRESYKYCKSCKTKKLKEEFFNMGSTLHTQVCRECYSKIPVHTQQDFIKNTSLFLQGLRLCGVCREIKSLDHFGKDKHTKHGYLTICKTCRRIRDKAVKMKLYYGLTLEELQSLYYGQNGKCKICNIEVSLIVKRNAKNKITQAVVDHCHTTGQIRGILCPTCNRALGLLKDQPTVLYSAIRYLKDAHNKLREFRESPEEGNPEPSPKNE